MNATPFLQWEMLLEEAVTRPGMILEAFSRFHGYSIGNQIAALFQCQVRQIEPGPIATFVKWKELGRSVKPGSRALWLCMPITLRSQPDPNDPDAKECITISFLWKPRWFVLSQTEGEPYEPEPIPAWSKETALATLQIDEVPFAETDGNIQGYAKGGQVAINPLAERPHATLFHELGHVLIGHTAEAATSDGVDIPRRLREAEAEAVALICCDALELPGAEFSRGYIQHWYGTGHPIPEASARAIFRVADAILRAGNG